MAFTNGIVAKKQRELYQYGDGLIQSKAIGYYNVMCWTGDGLTYDLTVYISWRSCGGLTMYRYEFGNTISYNKVVADLLKIKKGNSKRFGRSYGKWANWVKAQALFYVKVED